MTFDLTTIWAAIIALAIAAYVVMDGFDLGIGLVYPALKPGAQRDQAMNAVAPVWDGNETWLVLGGGGLLAAFPLAYSVILPALYAPIIAMLLGLVFRGVAFEFRWRDPAHKRFWDVSFFFGALVTTMAQGIVLGAVLQGISVTGRAYSGGWWDWLTPFSLLTGISLCVGFALLGTGWLILKTHGELQTLAFTLARLLLPAMLVCIVAVSLATPFLQTQYFARWFAFPGIIVAAPVPLLVALTAFLHWRALAKKRELAPFLLTLTLFGLSMAGLAISMWPDIIPGQMSIWDAAAPPASQSFMLVGTLIMVPLILIYTGWAYWVFRGKVGEAGYH